MPPPFVIVNSPPENVQVWYYPLTGSPVDISQRIFGLKFGTVAPGGDAELTYGINLAGDPTAFFPAAGAAIGVWDSGGVVWCGIVEETGGSYWSGAETLQIVCRGFVATCSDQTYTISNCVPPKIFTAGTAVSTVMATAASDLCPQINGFAGTVLGRVLPEDSQDFIFSTAQSIWTTVAPLGGDGTPLLWRVFSDIIAGAPVSNFPRATLHIEVRHTAPTYHTRMATNVSQRGGTEAKLVGNRQLVRNRVNVKYSDKTQAAGYSIVTQQATGSQGTLNGIGAIRDLCFDLSGVDDTTNPNILTIAQNAANQALAQLATLQTTGQTMTLHYPQVVLDAGNSPIALWRVRAGAIIQIDDLNVTGDSRIPATVFVNATEWDEDSRTLTLTVGPRYTWVEAMGRAMRRRTPGRGDTTVSTAVPEPGRKVQDGTKPGASAHAGSSNPGTPYSPADHSHGSWLADITIAYPVDNRPNAIPSAAGSAPESWVSLVQGTLRSWKIRCDQGSITFQVTLPNGSFTASGGNNATGVIGGANGILIESGTEGLIVVTAVTNTQSASLILNGDRTHP